MLSEGLIVEISGDAVAQLALSPLKRALDQQDQAGQQALTLIASAVPQTAQVQSPPPAEGAKGNVINTYA